MLSLFLCVSLAVIIVSILIRKWRYPKRAWFNCAMHILLIPIRQLGLGPFTENRPTFQTAMKSAMKETGLTDFGDLEFLDSYDQFFNKIEKDFPNLRISNFVYLLCSWELHQWMTNRLLLVQFLKDCPEIRKIPLKSPVFIISPPRTGTTFLQRLLDLDPDNRAPLLWELLSPVPKKRYPLSAEALQEDYIRRRKEWTFNIDFTHIIGENALLEVHEYAAHLPEECIAALPDELLTHSAWIYQIMTKWDVYADIMRGKKYQKALQHYKTILQLLSYQIGDIEQPRRWILKCPSHIFFIKDIVKVFPDAKFIFNHRHPKESVGSLCSFVKIRGAINYEREGINPLHIGQSMKNIMGKALVQAHNDLQEVGCSVSNVHYEDLTRNPIETIRHLYQEFGWIFTDNYERILQDYLAKDTIKRQQKVQEIQLKIQKTKVQKNQKNQKNQDHLIVHDYSLDEFGLTEEDLSTGLFAEYCKLYNISNPHYNRM